MVTIELKPGGEKIEVTEENKAEYVDCVVEYRISKRVKEQFDAFMSGFSELIPHDLITVFDERELELLIGGMSDIDVYVPNLLVSGVQQLTIIYSDDWTKFTDYRGYEVNDEVIQWFWKCVRSWPPERKSRLLQFATGTSRIPVNGFKDLQGSDGPRRFTIEKSGDPSQLPKSHTCFNRIDLPPYKDYATLEQKLTLAVEYVTILLCCFLSADSVPTPGRPLGSDRSKPTVPRQMSSREFVRAGTQDTDHTRSLYALSPFPLLSVDVDFYPTTLFLFSVLSCFSMIAGSRCTNSILLYILFMNFIAVTPRPSRFGGEGLLSETKPD